MEKKQLKKMTLSRETLRNLDDSVLKEAAGANTLANSCITDATRRCSNCATCEC